MLQLSSRWIKSWFLTPAFEIILLQIVIHLNMYFNYFPLMFQKN